MKPERDHIHAHFGTRRDLLLDQRYVRLVEEAESFCGAPFTLCRCSNLGKDTINLTGKVRQTLWEGRWVPESGFVEMGVLEPAHARWFSVDLRLPLDPGDLTEIHYRLEKSYFSPSQINTTIDFFKKVAVSLEVEFGYAHHALDETLQDTFDALHYRALTGEDPPRTPIDPRQNPGRSMQAGDYLVTCRWLSFFGPELVQSIGYTRVMDAPCHTETLDDDLAFLQLYSDPLNYNLVENRRIHLAVRKHLHLDDVIDRFGREPVEPPLTEEVQPVVPPPASDPAQTNAETPATPASTAMPFPLSAWLDLYDATPAGLPNEERFYTAEARRGAGRVLEIGCGTGRLTLPIARVGISVVGIDASPDTIHHLRSMLQAESSPVQGRTNLISGDILEKDLSGFGPFAAVFIPYRGINRYPDEHRLRELLQIARKNLQPGGILAFNTFFPPVHRLETEGDSVPRLVHWIPNPSGLGHLLVFDTLQLHHVRQRMTVHRQLQLLDEQRNVTRELWTTIQLRYFFPEEISYLLELMGFRATLFGGFDRQPLVRPDQEIVVIAQAV